MLVQPLGHLSVQGLLSTGSSLANGSLRITPGTNRRLRVFATTQIAFSFVLLASDGMLVAALIALQSANGEEDPYARSRAVSPGFFATLGIPLAAGREYTEDDRTGKERVEIVSQTLARRLFPNGDALNRNLWPTGSLNASNVPAKPVPARITGVVADVDDENESAPAMSIYWPHRAAACRCGCSCARQAIPTPSCRR